MYQKLDPNDLAFSGYIRRRDHWICQRCGRYFPPDDDGGNKGRMALHCSHWEGRDNQRTRFDPENADAFCFRCHQYMEPRKGTEYRDWKRQQLGTKRFNALVARSKGPIVPISQAEKDALGRKYRAMAQALVDNE